MDSSAARTIIIIDKEWILIVLALVVIKLYAVAGMEKVPRPISRLRWNVNVHQSRVGGISYSGDVTTLSCPVDVYTIMPSVPCNMNMRPSPPRTSVPQTRL